MREARGSCFSTTDSDIGGIGFGVGVFSEYAEDLHKFLYVANDHTEF